MSSRARWVASRRPRRCGAKSLEALEARTMLFASLVADLNLADYPSVPGDHLAVGPITFFTADDGLHGRELWKTDGTEAGTTLVKDIRPGIQSSGPTRLVNLNGTLLFAADDGETGVELWRSDGTEDGTTLLADINSGRGSNPGAPQPRTSPQAYLVVGDKLYFGADDGTSGNELWVTDGTPEGTRQVIDLWPGAFSSSPHALLSAGDTLFFAASNRLGNSTVPQLYKTDGTAEGTVRLTGDPGSPYSQDDPVTLVANSLYYSGAEPALARFTLYRTDGTPGAAQVVLVANSHINNFEELNGVLLFNTYGTNTRELWRSDGTPAGTVKLGTTSSSPFGYYKAKTASRIVSSSMPVGATSWDLLSTDGQAPGLQGVRSFETGPGNVVPGMVSFKGAAWFTAYDASAGGWRLWRSDGTAGGTAPVSAAPISFNGPAPLHAAGDFLYFEPSRPDGNGELWRTDGTPSGARLIENINQLGVGSSPQGGFTLNGLYYFTANGGDLWRTDGTLAGTTFVRAGAGMRGTTVALNGNVYAMGAPQVTGGFSQLWKTDGTPTGTSAVQPSTGNVDIESPPLLYNGRVYFNGRAEGGTELWASDGTPSGTVRLKDLNPGAEDSSPFGFTEFNGLLYFWASIKNTAGRTFSQLWKTDGTEAGTVPVSTNPDFAHGARRLMTAMGGSLYFFATNPDGMQLFKSDGTEAGTVALQWFPPAQPPDHLTAVEQRLFFTNPGEQGGRWLWTSDGTVAGTHTLGTQDVIPAPSSSGVTYAQAFWPVGLQVYFRGSEFEGGLELWKSDGTEAGTVRVKDFVPGGAGSAALPLVAADGLLFFAATTPENGRELWKTDGTEAGTVRVDDINPGTRDGNPTEAAFVSDGPLAGTVFFTATWDPAGPELWKVPTGVPRPPHVLGRHIFYNRSAVDGNNPAANAGDDAAIAADKVALLPGQTASFSNVTSYSRGINGVMIDVADLPASVTLTAADFDFGAARPPASITIRRGAGDNGTDRITLTWTDASGSVATTRALSNGWLRVTVKANAHTGLTIPDVFSFGNLIAETGSASGAVAGTLRVDATDLARTRAATHLGFNPTYDFNRDGRVNVLDLALSRANQGKSLSLLPASAAGIEFLSVAAPRTFDRPPHPPAHRTTHDLLATLT